MEPKWIKLSAIFSDKMANVSRLHPFSGFCEAKRPWVICAASCSLFVSFGCCCSLIRLIYCIQSKLVDVSTKSDQCVAVKVHMVEVDGVFVNPP